MDPRFRAPESEEFNSKEATWVMLSVLLVAESQQPNMISCPTQAEASCCWRAEALTAKIRA